MDDKLIPWLKAQLGSHIDEVQVQGDRPLLLDDPSYAYVTLSEHHGLFSVGYCAGIAHGCREHLAPIQAGRVLFGIEPRKDADACALMLSGVSGSSVWRIPTVALLELCARVEGRKAVGALLDSWITLLLTTLSAPAPDSCLQAVRSGERILASTSEALLQSGGGLQFAADFGALMLSCVSRTRADLSTERAVRDATSRAAADGQLQASLRALAAGGAASSVRCEAVATEPFAHACQRICSWLGVDSQPRIALPPGATLPQLRLSLEGLTGVRTRAVQLEPRFWNDDAGPLLAFLVESGHHHPVALLPCSGGYELHDPRGGKTLRVDARLSARLHPQAQHFYRSLPATTLGLRQVLQFSLARGGRDVTRVVLLGLAAGLLGVVVPLLTGQLFDRVIPGAERSLLLQLLLVLASVQVGTFCFDLLRGLSLVRLKLRMDSTLEAAIWDRLLRLPLTFFRDYTAGDLATRANGIGALREILSEVAVSSVLAAVFSVWNVALLFYFDPNLALAALGLLAVATLVALVAAHFELRRRRQVCELDGRIHGLLLQLFGGIAKLRTSGSESRAFVLWSRLFAARRDAITAGERVTTRVVVFQSVFPLLCSMVLYQLVFRDGTRALSTGAFLAFQAAFAGFLRAILEMISAALQALKAVPLYERARPIFDAPIERSGRSETSFELKGAIDVSHVSFHYADAGVPVLEDVDLRIEPGEFVAIVGASGSGKSTLLRLLLGFEAPAEGAIYYDGQALTSLDLRALRRQLGVVLQHSQVMPGDIFRNIVGNSGLTLEDAWRAARHAALDKDIQAMPMGMQTLITPGGGTLSGGQRQRLLIARALANRPKILLLDEATSALDNRAQAVVRDSLDELRVTRIVIAHRLSTIQKADKIVVLERGRVVRAGRFADVYPEARSTPRSSRRLARAMQLGLAPSTTTDQSNNRI